jgi:hypothetical protein
MLDGFSVGFEVDLQHLTESEGKTDPGTEGADVEQGNGPRVANKQDGAHGVRRDTVLQVVHEQRRCNAHNCQ